MQNAEQRNANQTRFKCCNNLVTADVRKIKKNLPAQYYLYFERSF